MFLERAGRPKGASGDPAVKYLTGDTIRVIIPGSQYYSREGKVEGVGPNLVIASIEGDIVAYEPREIRKVR